ncbi:MAG: recombination mediator RecR [Candidatus Gracilibacteria bacterium]|nr:recombination mediator RecR [Candidatus Gracilibacteria bacterium]
MPEILKKLINIISLLPGIGDKSATKLAFFLLNANSNYITNFAKTLVDLKQNIGKCEDCNSLLDSGKDKCEICSNKERKHDIICIVEEYLDMLSIEQTGYYNGTYHILGGAISPINGVFVGDLNFPTLFKRIENNSHTELILATNPNIEGEATAMYIKEEIEKRGLKNKVIITRLSKGISAGYIEYADNISLINSIKDRKEI